MQYSNYWRFGAVGSDVGRINEVTLDGWSYRGSTPAVGNLSEFNQPPRSTQPGHPSVGRRNEYRLKGGDALLCNWGVKADMVLFAGNTVWSISERVGDVCVDTLYKSTFTLLYFTLLYWTMHYSSSFWLIIRLNTHTLFSLIFNQIEYEYLVQPHYQQTVTATLQPLTQNVIIVVNDLESFLHACLQVTVMQFRVVYCIMCL